MNKAQDVSADCMLAGSLRMKNVLFSLQSYHGVAHRLAPPSFHSRLLPFQEYISIKHWPKKKHESNSSLATKVMQRTLKTCKVNRPFSLYPFHRVRRSPQATPKLSHQTLLAPLATSGRCCHSDGQVLVIPRESTAHVSVLGVRQCTRDTSTKRGLTTCGSLNT